jgi:hypothetical protein
MRQESQFREGLRRRKATWLELAGAIDTAQSALLARNYRLFMDMVGLQSILCKKLEGQNAISAAAPCSITANAHWDSALSNSFKPRALASEESDEVNALMEEISRTRARVRHSNRVQGALLRYASRSHMALRRMSEGGLATYDKPFSATQVLDGSSQE